MTDEDLSRAIDELEEDLVELAVALEKLRVEVMRRSIKIIGGKHHETR